MRGTSVTPVPDVDSSGFWQYHEQFALNRARHARREPSSTSAFRCNVPRSVAAQLSGRSGNVTLSAESSEGAPSLLEMVAFLEKRLEEQGQMVMEIRGELASRARLVSSMYSKGHMLTAGC
jgi:hypothetical protein